MYAKNGTHLNLYTNSNEFFVELVKIVVKRRSLWPKKKAKRSGQLFPKSEGNYT